MSDTTYITSLETLSIDPALSQLADKVGVLLRDGTNQEQRLTEALDPNYIKIDERTFKDFVLFFHRFAKHIVFYKPNYVADTDWSSFFALFDGLDNDPDGEKWKKLHRHIENGSMVTPHLGLLITFLHLFHYAQNHLNTLTERHLGYYYRDVLCFKEKPARPDRVHVIIELAKNTDQILINENTLLKAGKDDTNADIFYRVERETAINKAEVAQLKSLFIDKNEHTIQRIYAIPQANSKDGLGEPLAEEEAFLPFHQALFTPQSSPESIALFEAPVGFALSSPVLRLQEGKRTIIVEVYFGIQDISPNDPEYAEKFAKMQHFWADASFVKSNFKISLSTDTVWLEKDIDDLVLLPEEGLLTLCTYLSATDPPIVPYQQVILGDDYPDGEPVLKIQGTPQLDMDFYEVFAQYPVQSIRLAVAVERVGQLYLQSDLSPVETGKPFEPFGVQPRQRAAFYVSSPEAFTKHVEALSIDFTWKNLPDNFADYYDEYPSLRNQPFKVALSFLHAQQWLPLLNEQDEQLTYQIFAANKEQESIKVDQMRMAVAKIPTAISPDNEAIPALLNSNTRRGYLKIELVEPKDAFGHAVYANLYADRLADKLFKKSAQMLAMATTPPPISDKDKNAKGHADADRAQALKEMAAEADNIKLPNQPYSPIIEQLTLSYTASQVIRFDKPSQNHPKDLFYHLHPFGQAPINPAKGVYIMPLYQEQGGLYIGIEKLQPPQNISLLFQLAEGSGNPDLPIPTIQWQYLSRNQWITFDRSDILSDTTDGLMNTGIIVFKVPQAATEDNNIMPKGYHWLRMSVRNNILALNQIVAIKAQAISAIFVDQNNDPNRLRQPLAPNSIKELAISDTRIKLLTQPYSSFGGKIREQGNEFYTRISERLRHKNRAISVWDYERLVLEKFNEIYKVKCLPHTSHKSDFAPGNVTLITIPNLRNKNAVNRLQPKTPLNLLKAIKEYIGHYTSPFVRVEAQNPVYEEILVSFDVGFKAGYDIGLHVERLNEAIKQFLSPWAYEAQEDIIFGGRIHKSSIINFIEEKEYVDYVNNFVMYHKYREGNIMKEEPKDEAEARSSRSILVSVEQHRISPWKQGELTYTIPEGVGHMLIEINFEVEDDE